MPPLTTHTVKAPVLDRARLETLSRRLGDIGFTEDGIREVIGGAPSPDPWSFTTPNLQSGVSPLATIARLFCFGSPVERRHADAAFGSLTVEDLEALGLVEIGNGLVRPRVLIRPVNGLFVTSDLPSSSADVVLGAVPASDTLARLTVRRPAARAFDLGTGCGIQALLLARHAAEVVAVDINPHAIALASFNAALNGMTNVDVREGSWFAPVEGERFDIIACNPPYVISPDTAYTYRDGGLTRDQVSRMVVRESARHLADGGVATVLCNWIHDDDWAAPIRPWLAETGCDALLLHYATLDAVNYAKRWNADVQAREPGAFEPTVRRWLDHFRNERIERIGFGGVILRRRNATSHWVRALHMTAGPTGACSDQILRLFDAGDFLESAGGLHLFDHTFKLIDGHTVDQSLKFTRGQYAVAPAIFRSVPGLGLEAPIDARALEVLLECTGERRLGELTASTADARGESEDAVRALIEPTVRQLVEGGFMIPVSNPRQGGQTW